MKIIGLEEHFVTAPVLDACALSTPGGKILR